MQLAAESVPAPKGVRTRSTWHAAYNSKGSSASSSATQPVLTICWCGFLLQIWEYASRGQPALNLMQFTTALRLVALAQVGSSV